MPWYLQKWSSLLLCCLHGDSLNIAVWGTQLSVAVDEGESAKGGCSTSVEITVNREAREQRNEDLGGCQNRGWWSTWNKVSKSRYFPAPNKGWISQEWLPQTEVKYGYWCSSWNKVSSTGLILYLHVYTLSPSTHPPVTVACAPSARNSMRQTPE